MLKFPGVALRFVGVADAQNRLDPVTRALRRGSNRLPRHRPLWRRAEHRLPETEIERADLETIIAYLISGQFNDPIRVVAFNTLQHWSEDVSEYIAFEIQTRCDIEGNTVPEHIRGFVTSYTGPDRQLTLRLV